MAAAFDSGFARPGLETRDGYVTHRTVVVTFGVPRTAKILVHELTHAEMATYTPYDTLPTWFNEGAAAMVAGEPRCPPGLPAAVDDLRRVETKATWQAHLAATDATRELYCQSRHELERWAKPLGGRRAVGDALVRVMRGVADGTPFDLLYATPADPAAYASGAAL